MAQEEILKNHNRINGGQSKNYFSLAIKWVCVALLVGTVSGISSSLFLYSLDIITQIRLKNEYLVYLLPIAGVLIIFLQNNFDVNKGDSLNKIFDEIHNPRTKLPISMAPLIWIGTLLTHLFGGSAGREGTAIQMSTSLADFITQKIKIKNFFQNMNEDRKLILSMGLGSGFASAIGVPIAGAIFGFEVNRVHKLKFYSIFALFMASLTSVEVTHILAAPHTIYQSVNSVSYSLSVFIKVLLVSVIFGLASKFFILCVDKTNKISSSVFKNSYTRIFIVAIFLVFIFKYFALSKFQGLGLTEILLSFEEKASLSTPILKSFFTALTIGTGFKGGEFTPLVFVGSTLGSSLSNLFDLPTNFLAALGFASLFSGASNTPVASTILAIELFGPSIGPYAFISCFISMMVSGKIGIYKNQSRRYKKL